MYTWMYKCTKMFNWLLLTEESSRTLQCTVHREEDTLGNCTLHADCDSTVSLDQWSDQHKMERTKKH